MVQISLMRIRLMASCSRSSALLLALLLLLLLTVVSCSKSKAATCNRTRVVLEGDWGRFGDGPGEYPQASHCQWLIKGMSFESVF